MNNLFSLLFLILCMNSGLVKAQVVNIPDASFKSYLVGESAINTNGDNEIQVSEAQAFTGAIVSPIFSSTSIYDITGIEAFTEITELNIGFSFLTAVDLSANTALTNLNLGFNQLTALDISNNVALVELRVFSNQLTTLDVSNNTALTYLNISSNQIVRLDVSNCSLLTHFESIDNQMLELNIKNGNNVNFTTFDVRNNPNLNCIEVDDVAYSTTNWTNVDPGVSFSLSCGLGTAIDEIEASFTALQFFPNPTNGNVNIDLGKSYHQVEVIVTSLRGETVLIQDYAQTQTINLSLDDVIQGVYLITFQTPNESKTIKMIKE